MLGRLLHLFQITSTADHIIANHRTGVVCHSRDESPVTHDIKYNELIPDELVTDASAEIHADIVLLLRNLRRWKRYDSKSNSRF